MPLSAASGGRLKQTAFALGVGLRLQRLKWALEPEHVARDRRDNAHLRAVLAAVLAPDAHCIDVGAHRGEMLADFVRLAPRGRHIAYEPLPELHSELARRFPQVDVRRAALSDRSGEAEFVHVLTRPGWSGFRERPYPGQEDLERIAVRVERLDDSLPAGYSPSFIKIDVEGAEREVLAGAAETIAAHRPLVAFEHGLGSAEHYGTGPQDLWGLLVEAAGLRIFDLDGGGPYTSARFEEAFALGQRVNFFARP